MAKQKIKITRTTNKKSRKSKQKRRANKEDCWNRKISLQSGDYLERIKT